MIVFYDKRDGRIFAATDGRVHPESHLTHYVYDDSLGSIENVAKFIIGWIKKGDQKIAYNLDQMDTLKRIEAADELSALDFFVDQEKGILIEK